MGLTVFFLFDCRQRQVEVTASIGAPDIASSENIAASLETVEASAWATILQDEGVEIDPESVSVTKPALKPKPTPAPTSPARSQAPLPAQKAEADAETDNAKAGGNSISLATLSMVAIVGSLVVLAVGVGGFVVSGDGVFVTIAGGDAFCEEAKCRARKCLQSLRWHQHKPESCSLTQVMKRSHRRNKVHAAAVESISGEITSVGDDVANEEEEKQAQAQESSKGGAVHLHPSMKGTYPRRLFERVGIVLDRDRWQTGCEL